MWQAEQMKALIEAAANDMERAEHVILRRVNDEWYETYCTEAVDDAYAQWAKENGVDLDDELNVRKVEKKKKANTQKIEAFKGLKDNRDIQKKLKKEEQDNLEEEIEKAYNKVVEMGLFIDKDFKKEFRLKRDSLENMEVRESHSLPRIVNSNGENLSSVLRMSKNDKVAVRLFDKKSFPFLDLDFTNHGNEGEHQIVPHRHWIVSDEKTFNRQKSHITALFASDIMAAERILKELNLFELAVQKHKEQYKEG